MLKVLKYSSRYYESLTKLDPQIQLEPEESLVNLVITPLIHYQK